MAPKAVTRSSSIVRTAATTARCPAVIKLFPISEVAQAQQAAIKKPKSQRNGWDKKIIEAVESLKAGDATYDETLAKIRREQASREAWMRRKFSGRR